MISDDSKYDQQPQDSTEMKRSELLRALQTEIRRHTFDYFVENPPAMADGGHGIVVPGCPACRKRINTMAQFLDHLADDVLPPLVNKLSTEPKVLDGGTF